MGALIASDLEELSRREYRRLNMGIAPSGKLHLGSVMTAMAGLLYLQGKPGTHMEICVMDLDFDAQRGNVFLPFTHKPDPEGCHPLIRDHTRAELTHFVDSVTEALGIQRKYVSVGIFSEMVMKPIYLEAVMHLFKDKLRRKLVREIIMDERGNVHKVPLSPICPECNYSSAEFSKIDFEATKLTTTCNNRSCNSYDQKYSVLVTDTQRYSMHYLVDPVRDVFNGDGVEPADVHIFGGDYMESGYGVRGTPKAVRVQRLIRELMPKDNPRFSTNSPDIYVGPMITIGGAKMGKSTKNGFQFEELQTRENWVERLMDLVRDASAHTRIDYDVAKRYVS